MTYKQIGRQAGHTGRQPGNTADLTYKQLVDRQDTQAGGPEVQADTTYRQVGRQAGHKGRQSGDTGCDVQAGC